MIRVMPSTMPANYRFIANSEKQSKNASDTSPYLVRIGRMSDAMPIGSCRVATLNLATGTTPFAAPVLV